MRKSGLTIKACAKSLRRSRGAITQQLHRQGVVRQPKRQGLREWVASYVKAGRTDNWIALKLGMTVTNVKYHRQVSGLKPNRPIQARHRRRPKCFACGKACPIAIAPGWRKLSKWEIRPLRVPGLAIRFRDVEAYCPECFTRYGWPEQYRKEKTL